MPPELGSAEAASIFTDFLQEVALWPVFSASFSPSSSSSFQKSIDKRGMGEYSFESCLWETQDYREANGGLGLPVRYREAYKQMGLP